MMQQMVDNTISIFDELQKDGYEVGKTTGNSVIMKRYRNGRVDLVKVVNGKMAGEFTGITEIEANIILA